jgi:hypothetical protein
VPLVGQINLLGARTSYFPVQGRLQNNHVRRLAIVAEDAVNLEEVVGRGRGGKRTPPVPAKPTETAAGTRAAAISKRIG